MIQLVILGVGGFLMLLGIGLMIGSFIALIKPAKTVRDANGVEKKTIDWPVVVGLLVGGFVSYKIGHTIFSNMPGAGRLLKLRKLRG